MLTRAGLLKHPVSLASFLAIGSFVVAPSCSAVRGQEMSMPSQSNQNNVSGQTKSLQDQVTELKAQVARLQAAQRSVSKSKPMTSKGMPKSGQMSMEGEDAAEMGSMSAPASQVISPAMGQSGKSMSMGCCGMSSMGKPMKNGLAKPGSMKSMGGSQSMTATPYDNHAMSNDTQPSLLHFGAQEFFLDHGDHLGLTKDQRDTLGHIKAGALAEEAAFQHKIDTAEVELWQLTGSRQPDAEEIDRKVQQIARLRADQQTAHIHAVSHAAMQLAPEQQEMLLKGAAAH